MFVKDMLPRTSMYMWAMADQDSAEGTFILEAVNVSERIAKSGADRQCKSG